MLEGLYSAVAGMAAQQQRMDALANDVANVSTTGYKRVRLGFRDLVYQAPGRGAVASVAVGAGAAATPMGRGFEQGALQQTGQPLDVAIEGRGFFAVRQAGGQLALTRDGSFQLSPNGRLRTAAGDLIEPPITIPRNVALDQVRIGPDGRVTAGTRTLGTLRVFDVRSPEGLASIGDNLYAVTPASGPAVPARGAIVAQGTLEASNVDLGDAMVDMMDAQRSFQLASKAVQMQDQMLEVANGVKR